MKYPTLLTLFLLLSLSLSCSRNANINQDFTTLYIEAEDIKALDEIIEDIIFLPFQYKIKI